MLHVLECFSHLRHRVPYTMFLFEVSGFSTVSLYSPTDSGGPTAVGIAAAAISDVNNVHLPCYCWPSCILLMVSQDFICLQSNRTQLVSPRADLIFINS
jgi:hypothetical protein